MVEIIIINLKFGRMGKKMYFCGNKLDDNN